MANRNIISSRTGIKLKIMGGGFKMGEPRSHGHVMDGSKSPTYQSWQNMKQRCYNPSEIRYENYGGRGISVCERWLLSFENFLSDMGERPSGTTLDRRDVNGNYEPDNCRWATPKEQRDNFKKEIKQCAECGEVSLIERLYCSKKCRKRAHYKMERERLGLPLPKYEYDV